MSKIALSFLWIFLGVGITIGSSVLTSEPAIAQRKNISSKEVNGTFMATNGTQKIKVLSVGRGGLDRPGYQLQVELHDLGVIGAPVSTGKFSGYAEIVGDLATFIPDGMDSDRCKIEMKFTRPGFLTIEQQGTCLSNGNGISFAGNYRKKSSIKPTFEK